MEYADGGDLSQVYFIILFLVHQKNATVQKVPERSWVTYFDERIVECSRFSTQKQNNPLRYQDSEHISEQKWVDKVGWLGSVKKGE